MTSHTLNLDGDSMALLVYPLDAVKPRRSQPGRELKTSNQEKDNWEAVI